MNYKIVGSTGAAIAIGLTLGVLCFRIGTDVEAHALNVATLAFGLASGWIVGVLASPYDPKEAKAFSTYAKTAATFASGYVVGKVDGLVAAVVSPNIALSPVPGFRLMTFATAFMVSAVITFVYRQYARVPTS